MHKVYEGIIGIGYSSLILQEHDRRWQVKGVIVLQQDHRQDLVTDRKCIVPYLIKDKTIAVCQPNALTEKAANNCLLPEVVVGENREDRL